MGNESTIHYESIVINESNTESLWQNLPTFEFSALDPMHFAQN